MLSEKSQRNVINAVERKKAIDASRTSELKDVFPSFTPMELEVSRLIIRGLKLAQIQNATGKGESNINSVRSHIRKKLGLSIGQDLREELLKVLEGKTLSRFIKSRLSYYSRKCSDEKSSRQLYAKGHEEITPGKRSVAWGY